MLSTSAMRLADKGRKRTDLSGFVDVSGLDTDLASLGVDDARTVGTNKARLRLVLERVGNLEGGSTNSALDNDPPTYPDLVRLGDSLGNTNDQRNLVVDGFNNGVGCRWRWDIDHSRVRSSLLDSLHKESHAAHIDSSTLAIPNGQQFTHLLHRPKHR